MQVEDSLLPLETGLEGGQPWIAQYLVFSPDVGDQEPHLPLFLVSGYTEVDVSSNTPCLILGIIDVEQFLGFVQ